ncbi:radical SAM protein [Candidatus Sumerlaeota bacterium]|nr:radical SAM protein [Candidatus Sumerlaeota bacterium]
MNSEPKSGAVKRDIKKVLLLNPPGENIYLRDYFCSHASKASYYWGPFDLIVLSGILKEHFSLSALDAIILRSKPHQVLRYVKEQSPDAIIFLTGAVSWVEDFRLLKQIAEQLNPRPVMVGIGDILFAEGDEYLRKYEFLDAVITDFTSSEISDYLQGKRGEFRTISYKANGKVVSATRLKRVDEFSLPLPRYELFPFKKYRIPHGIRIPYAGILTDYGCAYHCDYCIGGELGFRLRNIDNTIEEMKYLKSLGIKELWIKDLTFGVNKQRTLTLLERMLQEELNLSWVCLSRANVIDEERLKLMKRAGCHTIQMGVETASDELLSKYSKGINRDIVRRAMELCKKVNIRVLAHFMLGLPGDTEENIRRTIQYALELDPYFASFNIVMPRMGTKFREKALKEGLVDKDVTVLDNSISYPVYDTPELSREQLWRLRNLAIRRFHLRPRFIVRRLFGVRSFYELRTLFSQGFSLLLTTWR